MTDTQKLKGRIAELEKKVAELETKLSVQHHHYHWNYPVYVPQTVIFPQPSLPWPSPYFGDNPTCGAICGTSNASTTDGYLLARN